MAEVFTRMADANVLWSSFWKVSRSLICLHSSKKNCSISKNVCCYISISIANQSQPPGKERRKSLAIFTCLLQVKRYVEHVTVCRTSKRATSPSF